LEGAECLRKLLKIHKRTTRVLHLNTQKRSYFECIVGSAMSQYTSGSWQQKDKQKGLERKMTYNKSE